MWPGTQFNVEKKSIKRIKCHVIVRNVKGWILWLKARIISVSKNHLSLFQSTKCSDVKGWNLRFKVTKISVSKKHLSLFQSTIFSEWDEIKLKSWQTLIRLLPPKKIVHFGGDESSGSASTLRLHWHPSDIERRRATRSVICTWSVRCEP